MFRFKIIIANVMFDYLAGTPVRVLCFDICMFNSNLD